MRVLEKQDVFSSQRKFLFKENVYMNTNKSSQIQGSSNVYSALDLWTA